MNVLVVERDADWSQWSSTSHVVGHAMLVLVQQADETTSAFRARIQQRLARIKQSLGSLVVLRGKRRSGLKIDALVSGLAGRAPKDVRTYSGYLHNGFSMGAASPA
ncbi:MAG: hypothetical protein ABW321_31315 [Polyangiales bacterium]